MEGTFEEGRGKENNLEFFLYRRSKSDFSHIIYSIMQGWHREESQIHKRDSNHGAGEKLEGKRFLYQKNKDCVIIVLLLGGGSWGCVLIILVYRNTLTLVRPLLL